VNIDLKQLEGLLKVLEDRDISEFEFEDEKIRVHLKRGQPIVAMTTSMPHHVPAHPNDVASSAGVEGGSAKQGEGNVAYVTSPFVGTFYRSPSPDAPPFVDVGSNIRPGQALCIVEAMKLMNEVAANEAGRVAEILVENGQWVEFEQVLMYLEPVEE
jgi:acetyl-CoA carboxylase biotin carboxyl carrier protein